MENKTYEFDNGPGQSFQVTLSDQGLTILNKLIRRKTEIPFNAIEKLHVKKFFSKVKLIVSYQNNGKTKNTYFIFEPIGLQAKEFMENLKSYVPSSQKWQSDFQNANTLGEAQSFTLASKFLGRYTPRSGIILLWLVMALTIIGLPFFLYLVFLKGYHAKITSDGLELKKFLPKRFAWSDIKNINVSLTNVRIRSHGAVVGENLWCNFEVETLSGQKSKFCTQSIQGAELMKIFIQHNKMNASYAQEIAI